MYLTGDIITTTASSNPLLLHKAIIIMEGAEPFVLHNSPMLVNVAGGSVGYESLKDFEADGRKVLRVEHTNLSKEHILAAGESVAREKFHITSFNCEQFVSYVQNGNFHSPQMEKWMLAGLCGVFLIT